MAEKKRLISLDAFRGLTIILMLLVNNAGDWGHVMRPIEHAEWHGCTLADLVFPFFVFIMGVAMPMGKINYPHVIKRTLKLFGLGVILSLVAWWAYMDHFRLMGVLQRLALTYLVLAHIILLQKPKLEICLFWGILLAYGAALIFCSADGFPMFYNLQDIIDTKILGSLNYDFDNTLQMGHDPEGLFSTIPTIASGLAGVYCGRQLKVNKFPYWGIGLIFLGLAASFIIPLNKNLWTPSYVIYSSGWAFLVLGLCYYLIDIKKITRVFYPFIAYGSNAITIYFAASVLALVTVGIKIKGPLFKATYDQLAPYVGDYLPSALWGMNYVILFFFVASFMYRKKWFVKI